MKTEKIICRFRLQFVTLLLMVSMVLPTVMWAAITPTKPSSGDGSSSNPYQISSAAHLYWFAGLVNGTITGVDKNPAACAKLTANITVNSGVLKSDGTINSGSVSGFTAWTPIGQGTNSFNGTFDGNGKTISGLHLDNADMDYIGLFGFSYGTIQNVGVVDSYFHGKS